MASVAAITRSSTLEVINEDLYFDRKSKRTFAYTCYFASCGFECLDSDCDCCLVCRFGGMLGGSSVTEKVFNINGIGSYIVDKQFIPDIPV